MNKDFLDKIKMRALRKGSAARGASINETLQMVDMITKMTKQFEQIAVNYGLNDAAVNICENCTTKYPADWVINNTCPFCLGKHKPDAE